MATVSPSGGAVVVVAFWRWLRRRGGGRRWSRSSDPQLWANAQITMMQREQDRSRPCQAQLPAAAPPRRGPERDEADRTNGGSSPEPRLRASRATATTSTSTPPGSFAASSARRRIAARRPEGISLELGHLPGVHRAALERERDRAPHAQLAAVGGIGRDEVALGGHVQLDEAAPPDCPGPSPTSRPPTSPCRSSSSWAPANDVADVVGEPGQLQLDVVGGHLGEPIRALQRVHQDVDGVAAVATVAAGQPLEQVVEIDGGGDDHRGTVWPTRRSGK